MSDQPINSEANAALPWIEAESTDQGDNQDDTDRETDQQFNDSN
jgi:hypothetical protein